MTKVYIGERVHHPTNTERAIWVEQAHARRQLEHIAFHSPTGFEWGYPGSGPADLALAILADYFGETPAEVLPSMRSMWERRTKAGALYQDFKFAFVQHFGDRWRLESDEIARWLETPRVAQRMAEVDLENEELAKIAALEAQE